MKPKQRSPAKSLRAGLQQAHARIQELEDTLNAIRAGAIDALIVPGEQGPKVFTLQGADEPYRILLEQMNEGAATVSAEGVILFCNRGFAEMVQLPLESVIGSRLENYLDPGVAGEVKSWQPSGVRRESHLRRHDGSALPVLLSFRHMTVSGQPVIFLVAADNTLQNEQKQLLRLSEKKLEQRVHERTAELELANRELESFSYSVSHDLRAPLRALAGFSQILLKDHAAELSPEARTHLQFVDESARRMGEMVDALLGLSRLGRQALALRRLQPAELIQQVLTDLRLQEQEREIRLTIGELPACHADPVLLRQVFFNLLSNAVKYTAREKVAAIEVGAACFKDLPPDAKAAAGAPVPGSECTVYYVRDNGVGFDMHYAHKLFTVFQRLHSQRDFEGTGVGLATVQRIIHRHGGRVWAEGRQNRGATFYFTIGNARTGEQAMQKSATA